MKAYEDTLYDQWKENVEQILPSLLRHNLLTKTLKDSVLDGQPTATVHDTEDDEGEISLNSFIRAKSGSVHMKFVCNINDKENKKCNI